MLLPNSYSLSHYLFLSLPLFSSLCSALLPQEQQCYCQSIGSNQIKENRHHSHAWENELGISPFSERCCCKVCCSLTWHSCLPLWPSCPPSPTPIPWRLPPKCHAAQASISSLKQRYASSPLHGGHVWHVVIPLLWNLSSSSASSVQLDSVY